MKKTILFFAAASLLLAPSCKKHGCTDSNALNYSNVAKKDDGSCIIPTQTVFEEQFTLTFGPGASLDIYYPLFNYQPGDVIILENLSDPTYNYWSALPIVSSGAVVWGEYGDDEGDIWIYTDEVSTGNDFPWVSNVTFGFRALLIKKYAIQKNPDLKNMTIDEVKELLQ